MILQDKESGDFQCIAAYGQGIALLSIAQRDLQDGKAGSAFAKINRAIDGCLPLAGEFSCVHKLLGDLYSFGALIPPALFNEGCGNGYAKHDDDMKKQLDFVSQGESAYRLALVAIQAHLQSDTSYTCDVASNILLQAKLIALSEEIGTVGSISSTLYSKAAEDFKSALISNPINAMAWCGLGCAVEDPLLAQRK